jgi:hypothetical protein
LEKIVIKTADQRSVVAVGEKWTNVADYLPEGRKVIITDDNLFEQYGHQDRKSVV